MWQRTYLILIKSIGTIYAFFLTGSAIYKHNEYTTTKKKTIHIFKSAAYGLVTFAC